MILINQLFAHYDVQTNLYAFIIGLPIMALLIWYFVGLALKPLKPLSSEITERASTNLSPIDPNQVPIELQPIVNELNHLFDHLKEALVKNKRFASDAAHELKTPLAASKLQAQVAKNATDPKNSKKHGH